MVNRVAEDALQGNQHFHRIISLSLKKSMKKEQELIVITKTYDLILWSCNHTSRFPRNHRFVLGERIERNLYNLLETLIAGTDQGFGVSLEHEDGDTGDGQGRCWEISAYTMAARHAAKCAESGQAQYVVWPSRARTG